MNIDHQRYLLYVFGGEPDDPVVPAAAGFDAMNSLIAWFMIIGVSDRQSDAPC